MCHVIEQSREPHNPAGVGAINQERLFWALASTTLPRPLLYLN